MDEELFGHEAGAYTGAAHPRAGCLEQAAGGTVFLDEIGELPRPLQAKLLCALEDGWVRRLGGARVIPIDVRFVAATHRDLRAMVEAGAFREDLLYRVQVIRLTIPPLAERRPDIAEIVGAYLRARGAPAPTDAVIPWLERRAWPGNVRELHGVVEAGLAEAEGQALDVEHLERAAPPPRGRLVDPELAVAPKNARELGELVVRLGLGLHDVVREVIRAALASEDGNLTRAAGRLDVGRKVVERRAANLDVPRRLHRRT